MAYEDGDWDFFMGQAFNFTRKAHVIEPMPIPRNAHIYMTYDWDRVRVWGMIDANKPAKEINGKIAVS